MSDLDLITELRPDERLPGDAELAPARDRLGAAVRAETEALAFNSFLREGGGAHPGANLRPARRAALAFVAAGAAAAGVAAAVLVTVPGHADARLRAPASTAKPSVKPPVKGSTAGTTAPGGSGAP